jgi:hypothetical protein
MYFLRDGNGDQRKPEAVQQKSILLKSYSE